MCKDNQPDCSTEKFSQPQRSYGISDFYMYLIQSVYIRVNISACVSLCVCVYAWLPRRVHRLGWARTESCAQQLPAAASDRHSTALISWPVTIDTHSCAALREQTEHRQRLQGAGKSQQWKRKTLMNTSKTSVNTFRTKDATSCFCPRGYPAI